MELKLILLFSLMMVTQKTCFRFVNNVRTKDGGTHEVGAKTAMTRELLMNMLEKMLIKRKR